jgi:AcrR family transcriptional regulator
MAGDRDLTAGPRTTPTAATPGDPAGARRRGRPRAAGTGAGDAREEILTVAAALFAAGGYAGTGTREIAAASGLRQASLFHWFARKEDILAELLDRTVAPALAVSDASRVADAGADVRLYALARNDVANLCSGPVNLGALQLLPEARAPAFAGFWARRAELRDRYRELLGELARTGRLAGDDPELATDVVFGLVESVITWFDRGGTVPADRVADAVALAAVRSVVQRPGAPARLRTGADRLVGGRVPPGGRARGPGRDDAPTAG